MKCLVNFQISRKQLLNENFLYGIVNFWYKKNEYFFIYVDFDIFFFFYGNYKIASYILMHLCMHLAIYADFEFNSSSIARRQANYALQLVTRKWRKKKRDRL